MLRRAARSAEASRSPAEQGHGVERCARAEERAHRERQRTLHDEVLVALGGIAEAGDRASGGEPSADAARRVQDACRAALRAVSADPAVPAPASADVRELLARRAGTARTRTQVLADHGLRVPAAVADALDGALAEGLRNVDRHARASVAVLSARRTRSGVTVTLEDDGIGCRPREPVEEPSFGVRGSMQGRMADVGGSVSVGGGTGGGTCVTLEWQPEGDPSRAPDRSEVPALVAGDVRAPPLVVWTLSTGRPVAARPAIPVARGGRGVLTEESAAIESRSALHGWRAEEMIDEVVPLLRAVAEDPRLLGEGAVRRQGAALARHVRDELLLPGVLDARSRAALATARRGGCRVRLRCDADAMGLPRWIGDALCAALDGPAPREMTLSVQRDPEGTRVTVIVVPGDAERLERVEAQLSGRAPVIDLSDGALAVDLRG